MKKDSSFLLKPKKPKRVYLCEKVSLVNEMYFAITLDRTTAGPLIIACRKGGTSIEDLAEKFPDMIIKQDLEKDAAPRDVLMGDREERGSSKDGSDSAETSASSYGKQQLDEDAAPRGD